MKNLTRTVAVCIALFAFAFVSTAQTETELKSQIEKMNKEMAQAMLDGNYEQNLVYYDEDIISLPNNDKMLNGIEEVKKMNEEMKKSGWKVTEYTTETKSVKSHGDMVTEIGTYKIAFKAPETDKPVKDEGKYITIWEKQADGSLKVVTEMWNTDMSMQDQMAAMQGHMNDNKDKMGENKDKMGEMHDKMHENDKDMKDMEKKENKNKETMGENKENEENKIENQEDLK